MKLNQAVSSFLRLYGPNNELYACGDSDDERAASYIGETHASRDGWMLDMDGNRRQSNSQQEPAHGRLGATRRALFSTLEGLGCRGCMVPIRHLSDLRERLEKAYKLELFDEEFYQERLTAFAFSPPDHLREAQSIMIVAYPHPQTRVTFTWNGKPVRVIIPPTYLYDTEGDRRIQELLATTLGPTGYHVTEASLPKKMLAGCSGLGSYGKNNILYVDGTGSFVRLAVFYSDLSCPEDHWQEPQMMEACQKCSACANKCPTGAITSDRFLLLAERCITYHNEKPGHVPFPSWLDPSWHNCLVGCMSCQRICPKNKGFLRKVEDGATFSQEETELLMKGGSLDQLPAALVEKIEHFDMVEFLDIFPRNLRVLFAKVET
jgi:epoxyqueuosine reductase